MPVSAGHHMGPERVFGGFFALAVRHPVPPDELCAVPEPPLTVRNRRRTPSWALRSRNPECPCVSSPCPSEWVSGLRRPSGRFLTRSRHSRTSLQALTAGRLLALTPGMPVPSRDPATGRYLPRLRADGRALRALAACLATAGALAATSQATGNAPGWVANCVGVDRISGSEPSLTPARVAPLRRPLLTRGDWTSLLLVLAVILAACAHLSHRWREI